MIGRVFSTASFDHSRRHRFTLQRMWGEPTTTENRMALWIMLNPSTADEAIDDPTIRKVRGFTERLGLDGFTVVNLYPLRATKPKELWATPPDFAARDENDHRLRVEIAQLYPYKIAAWGRHARPPEVRRFTQWCARTGVPLWSLRENKDGSPAHPLMLPYSCIDTMAPMELDRR